MVRFFIPEKTFAFSHCQRITILSFFLLHSISIPGITVVLPIDNKITNPDSMTAPFGIVNVGMMLITIFYFAMAFYGYLRFGPESLASITLNLPHDSLYGRYGRCTNRLKRLITNRYPKGNMWSSLPVALHG